MQLYKYIIKTFFKCLNFYVGYIDSFDKLDYFLNRIIITVILFLFSDFNYHII
jgi:hypothetical protein